MIKIYKTYEIDDNLWNEIADGFNESFEGYDMTGDKLKNGYFKSNQIGYALHAIDFDDHTGEVRGFNSYTPTLYNNGIKAFVSGSTFVRKQFRKDIFIFGDLLSSLRKEAKGLGYDIEIGIPNHNSREYAKKLLKTIYIADLDYYMLPVNVSKCINKRSVKFLDVFTRLFSVIHVDLQAVMSKFFNMKESPVKYSLVKDKEYFKCRYQNSCYVNYNDDKYNIIYRIYQEGSAKVAYLMEFRENEKPSFKSLVKAVRIILRKEKPDAIMYVGTMRIKQFCLFKVPHKLIPKPLPLTYYVLDKSKKATFEDMKDIANWDFSLANFDVR